MKRKENMKFWKKINLKKIHNKFKQHSINIKNYTAHPHDMVHVPAKFRENTAMRFWVTVRKLNVTDGRTDRWTDRQTDGGRCNISRPGPPAPREIINRIWRAYWENFSSNLEGYFWANDQKSRCFEQIFEKLQYLCLYTRVIIL